MKVIIEAIGNPPDGESSEVGATIETKMDSLPRMGETVHYHNDINDQDLSVRIIDLHRRIHVKTNGTIRESAIITGILDPES